MNGSQELAAETQEKIRVSGLNSPSERSEDGLTVPIMPKTLVAEFLTKCVLKAETGCWLWKGKISHGRSPLFCYHGRTTSALRTSWELFVGAPPVAGQFRRTCGNLLCVCPHHLSHAALEPAKRKDRASPFRKLSAEAVVDIRSSTSSKQTLARKYGVSEWTIWAVRKGRRGKIVAIQPEVSPRTVRELERREFITQTSEILKDLKKNVRQLD